MPSQNGLFWPIPITLSAEEEYAKSIAVGDEVALWDVETESLMGTMKIAEKYAIDREYECKQVFRTADPAHPGVQKVMEQGAVNLAGPVKVVSESFFPSSRAFTSVRPSRAKRSPSVAGPPSLRSSFAIRCTIPTPIWRSPPP